MDILSSVSVECSVLEAPRCATMEMEMLCSVQKHSTSAPLPAYCCWGPPVHSTPARPRSRRARISLAAAPDWGSGARLHCNERAMAPPRDKKDAAAHSERRHSNAATTQPRARAPAAGGFTGGGRAANAAVKDSALSPMPPAAGHAGARRRKLSTYVPGR